MESRFRFVLVCVCLVACQSRAPRPETDLAIRRAVGVDQRIDVRVEGMPVDESDVDGATLSLDTALALTLQNSPEIQTSLARVRSAIADADQARLLPNPLLEFVLRSPEGSGRADLEIGIAADLQALLRRNSTAETADLRLAVAVREAVSTSVTIATELRENYATARALDELLPLMRERRAAAERLLALARSNLVVGEGSRIQVTTLEARAVELEIELRERENESSEERLKLARRIGRPSGRVDWELSTRVIVSATSVDEAQWIALALEHRSEIQAIEWRLAALGVEARSAGSDTWTGLEIGLKTERSDVWSTGPSLQTPLPIFDDGSTRRERADARVLEAMHELTRTRREVVEDVRRALASHRSVLENLARVRDELIPLQRSRRDQVEAMHRAGFADVGALWLAEQELVGARAKLIEIERGAFVTLVRLEHSVGGAGIAQLANEGLEEKR